MPMCVFLYMKCVFVCIYISEDSCTVHMCYNISCKP